MNKSVLNNVDLIVVALGPRSFQFQCLHRSLFNKSSTICGFYYLFVQVNLDSFAGDDDKRFEGATVCNDAGHARSALAISRLWDRNGGIIEVNGIRYPQAGCVNSCIELCLIYVVYYYRWDSR
jgi:hypothetical protein